MSDLVGDGSCSLVVSGGPASADRLWLAQASPADQGDGRGEESEEAELATRVQAATLASWSLTALLSSREVAHQVELRLANHVLQEAEKAGFSRLAAMLRIQLVQSDVLGYYQHRLESAAKKTGQQQYVWLERGFRTTLKSARDRLRYLIAVVQSEEWVAIYIMTRALLCQLERLLGLRADELASSYLLSNRRLERHLHAPLHKKIFLELAQARHLPLSLDAINTLAQTLQKFSFTSATGIDETVAKILCPLLAHGAHPARVYFRRMLRLSLIVPQHSASLTVDGISPLGSPRQRSREVSDEPELLVGSESICTSRTINGNGNSRRTQLLAFPNLYMFAFAGTPPDALTSTERSAPKLPQRLSLEEHFVERLKLHLERHRLVGMAIPKAPSISATSAELCPFWELRAYRRLRRSRGAGDEAEEGSLFAQSTHDGEQRGDGGGAETGGQLLSTSTSKQDPSPSGGGSRRWYNLKRSSKTSSLGHPLSAGLDKAHSTLLTTAQHASLRWGLRLKKLNHKLNHASTAMRKREPDVPKGGGGLPPLNRDEAGEDRARDSLSKARDSHPTITLQRMCSGPACITGNIELRDKAEDTRLRSQTNDVVSHYEDETSCNSSELLSSSAAGGSKLTSQALKVMFCGGSEMPFKESVPYLETPALDLGEEARITVYFFNYLCRELPVQSVILRLASAVTGDPFFLYLSCSCSPDGATSLFRLPQGLGYLTFRFVIGVIGSFTLDQIHLIFGDTVLTQSLGDLPPDELLRPAFAAVFPAAKHLLSNDWLGGINALGATSLFPDGDAGLLWLHTTSSRLTFQPPSLKWFSVEVSAVSRAPLWLMGPTAVSPNSLSFLKVRLVNQTPLAVAQGLTLSLWSPDLGTSVVRNQKVPSTSTNKRGAGTLLFLGGAWVVGSSSRIPWERAAANERDPLWPSDALLRIPPFQTDIEILVPFTALVTQNSKLRSFFLRCSLGFPNPLSTGSKRTEEDKASSETSLNGQYLGVFDLTTASGSRPGDEEGSCVQRFFREASLSLHIHSVIEQALSVVTEDSAALVDFTSEPESLIVCRISSSVASLRVEEVECDRRFTFLGNRSFNLGKGQAGALLARGVLATASKASTLVKACVRVSPLTATSPKNQDTVRVALMGEIAERDLADLAQIILEQQPTFCTIENDGLTFQLYFQPGAEALDVHDHIATSIEIQFGAKQSIEIGDVQGGIRALQWQPLAMRLRIHNKREDQPLSLRYTIHSHPNQWLVSGVQSAYVEVPPSSCKEVSSASVIPLSAGFVRMPQVTFFESERPVDHHMKQASAPTHAFPSQRRKKHSPRRPVGTGWPRTSPRKRDRSNAFDCAGAVVALEDMRVGSSLNPSTTEILSSLASSSSSTIKGRPVPYSAISYNVHHVLVEPAITTTTVAAFS